MAYHAHMEQYISNQVRVWKLQKEAIDSIDFKPKSAKGTKPFITISREYGSGAYQVAEKLIILLNEKFKNDHNWAAYDRNLLEKIANDMGLSESLAQTLTTNARNKMTELFQTTSVHFRLRLLYTESLRKLQECLLTTGMLYWQGELQPG